MCYLVRTPGGNTGPVRDAESPRVDQYCIYSTVPGTAVQYSSATVLYCTREFMCYLVHKVPGGNSGPESAWELSSYSEYSSATVATLHCNTILQ